MYVTRTRHLDTQTPSVDIRVAESPGQAEPSERNRRPARQLDTQTPSAGIGEFTWQPVCLGQLLQTLPNETALHYHGVDIVPTKGIITFDQDLI